MSGLHFESMADMPPRKQPLRIVDLISAIAFIVLSDALDSSNRTSSMVESFLP